ncbi:pyridoxal phosphate-dependent aminotransferase [Pseudonocardia sp. N23]|uniref:pyridoxal phosphate-dependent aminotransferase n=1 Tax=Pseudonocardia sp. N23 TaxID=1987376 RepID=UPI000BFB8FD9|nr:pyridoxal phosphate-dependent aminotransferase [Pseudonocardia sp. N23]GAY10239.1 aspartate aminotransferase [Pseudonocardia sp. N23]
MATASTTSTPRNRISARIGGIAESATLAVDAKAKALKAAGRPVIGFGAGEPDFPTPPAIVAAAQAACADPKNHRYTPAAGLPELREAIAAKTKRDSGFDVAASQVLVTNGGKQAVYQAFATIIDPGDEVILPAPYWTTYPEAISLAGGVPVKIVTGPDADYLPSVEQLEAARTPRTKALLWCSPSNPTGSVASRELTEAVGRWAAENDVWVITDEIYEHLVYDGAEAASVPVVVPEIADRTIVLNGVAKTYAMTGWRVGWMIGPADVIKAAGNLQSHLSSNVANVSQRAALEAVSGPLDAVAEMRKAFDRRRRTIVELLSAIPGVQCPTPRGAFYVYPAVGELLGKEIRGTVANTSVDLAALILEHAEVAVVPGEAFGTPGFFRLSYALGDDDLRTGVTRMGELLAEAK